MRTRLLLGFSLIPAVFTSLFLPADHSSLRAATYVATPTASAQTPDPIWELKAEHAAMLAALPKPAPTTTTTVAPRPVVHHAYVAPVVHHTYVAPAPVPSAPSPAGHWCYDLPDNSYARYIVAHESGCNVYAVNPRSGACGIPQFLPCRSYGWNGKAQTDAMISYVMGRYGSWAAAYYHKISTGWY